ncbi:MAG TPA: helix-turn-helix transcriptional regulator [Candidatus Paceibacterota bacterium]|nr:helix-turn-helix transcriptional regulator [Candidatus Paceibacterota bacterium]
MTDRERAICLRIKAIREQIKWSQSDFAKELGISRAKLVSIEYGHTPLRFFLAEKICRTFDVQAKWLATGQGEMRPFLPILWTAEQRSNLKVTDLLTKTYDFCPLNFELWPKTRYTRGSVPVNFDFKKAIDVQIWLQCSTIKFHDPDSAWEFTGKFCKFLKTNLRKYVATGKAVKTKLGLYTANLLNVHFGEKKDLTEITLKGNNTGEVKSETQKLIAQVKRKASKPGSKAELALLLGVKPPRISEWLSGKKEPGGEYTLKLLNWVESP